MVSPIEGVAEGHFVPKLLRALGAGHILLAVLGPLPKQAVCSKGIVGEDGRGDDAGGVVHVEFFIDARGKVLGELLEERGLLDENAVGVDPEDGLFELLQLAVDKKGLVGAVDLPASKGGNPLDLMGDAELLTRFDEVLHFELVEGVFGVKGDDNWKMHKAPLLS